MVISGGAFPIALRNFVGCIGQAVGVDVDANAATRTLHVFARFQSPDAPFKVMAATRTLKFDNVGVDVWHRVSFVWFCRPVGAGPTLRARQLPTASFARKAAFSVPHIKHRSGQKPALLSDYEAETLAPMTAHAIERSRARPHLSTPCGIFGKLA